ncbi:hypothetical protein CHS0354_038749 [Potamilus streckersoni]|uniref:Proteasome assembly chaperone 4 n=1 Tax=Potamilus streckersoni TaxID=2493646 RepID=A0AAE0SR94_9BIVA|nr:hypothetical protein CHS0354_038749 [Potamilus streckersoni]
MMETKQADSGNIPFPANIAIHTFSEKIMDTYMYFQVLKLSDSFWLWIGSSPAKFGDFTVAMNSGKMPCSTVLLGNSDSGCLAMATRLAKRTGKQVFISGDLTFNQIQLPLIEKRVAEEMKQHPDNF